MRIFNINFYHKGNSYAALVSLSGSEDDNARIQVTTNAETIQIMLPTGRLIFSIEEVMQRLYAARKNSENAYMYITPTISLQLLNTNW